MPNFLVHAWIQFHFYTFFVSLLAQELPLQVPHDTRNNKEDQKEQNLTDISFS